MDDERFHELISAYFDGEATPGERAEAEKALADSPMRRAEFEEIERLSALLSGLPRQSAPPEFRSRVMHAAERRMLLPAQVGRPALVRWRIWRRSGALAATAAALLLAMLAVGRYRDSGEREQAATHSTLRSESPAAIAESRARPVPGFGLGGGESASSARAAADASERFGNRSRVSSARLEFDEVALRNAEVGEVIEALDRSGGEVNVVVLTVVDRQQSLADLQVVLSKNGVPVESPVVENPRDNEGAPQDDLVAVYVEAEDDQLAAAMELIRNSEQFQSLAVEEPVALAALGESIQNQIPLGRRTSSNAAASREGDAGTAAESTNEKTTPLAAAGKPEAAKPQSETAKDAAPQQIQVPVPEEIRARALERKETLVRRAQPGPQQQATERSLAESAPANSPLAAREGSPADAPTPRPPAEAESRAGSTEAGGRGGSSGEGPLHVLFVLMGER